MIVIVTPVAGLVVLALWVLRNIRSDTIHQVAWIAGVSQAFVALVPILVLVIGTLALIAVGILALVALAARSVLAWQEDHVICEIELDFGEGKIREWDRFGINDIVVPVITSQKPSAIIDSQLPNLKGFSPNSSAEFLR